MPSPYLSPQCIWERTNIHYIHIQQIMGNLGQYLGSWYHNDVIKWKHFPRYWPFVRGIHRSPVNSPRKGQWRGALVVSLICVWINGWVNNREAGDLRRYRAHYDVIVMILARQIFNIRVIDCVISTDSCIPWGLTHLSLDNMAAILQTIFSNVLLWLKFHWSLFLRLRV